MATSVTFERQFEAARGAGVPIVAVRTADQWGTEADMAALPSVKEEGFAAVRWDAARGFSHINKPGEDALKELYRLLKLEPRDTEGFVSAMIAAASLPRGTVLFAHNAHRQLASMEPATSAAAVQAISNLRDVFKKNHRTAVLGGPFFMTPAELGQDMVVMDHALPGDAELAKVVRLVFASTQPPLPEPGAEQVRLAVEAIRGLSKFAAEQVVAMALVEDDGTGKPGLDYYLLWERKRMQIEQTRGLKVWRGGEMFKDIRGCDGVIARLRQQLKARTPVGVVFYMDEIDKVMANVEHDTSGVRMDQLRTLLTEMEDNRWKGCVFMGVPGAGKSLLAKAFGNEAGVPTIAVDFGAMEEGLVGASEGNLRMAISVIKAVGGGNAFGIATSNNASIMRPELQRRFTKGMFFFDVPTAEQQAQVWDYYEAKYEITKQARPECAGWSPAEIRNCCEEAWDCGVSLKEAAGYIIPMVASRVDEINALRAHATGRYLDAARPGQKYDAKAQLQDKVMTELLREINIPGKAN